MGRLSVTGDESDLVSLSEMPISLSAEIEIPFYTIVAICDGFL